MVIELSGVSVRRGDVRILADVDWRVEAGEHWAVVGANGSGKTTLLQVVAGMIFPTAGIVRVLGGEFGKIDLQKLRRRIGWVSSALQAWIAPHETLASVVRSGLAGTLGYVPDPGGSGGPGEERAAADADARATAAVEAMLARMGLSGKAARAFGVLSQGERQQALLARALLPGPEILILDEACAGLDIAARERLLERVASLAGGSSSPTMLWVTHHAEEILPTFSKTLVLRAGGVEAAGRTPSTLTSDVLSRALGVGVRVSAANGRYATAIDGHDY